MRNPAILEAYRDFRGALKQAEVMALEVLKTAEAKLEEAKKAYEDFSRIIAERDVPSEAAGWRVLAIRPVMSLNDAVSCPSWSSDRTIMRCSKFPLLTRSVPLKRRSSCSCQCTPLPVRSPSATLSAPAASAIRAVPILEEYI